MADFLALQRQFAGHLRDPERVPAPAGIQDRRMAVYRELAFNNIAGLLAANFPILRSLHADAAWHALVRDWYRSHRARTPLFPALGGEFVAWLQPAADRPAWLAELADYEWMATVAGHDPSPLAAQAHDPEGDLLAGRPLLSPRVWPLRYRHAVHRIGLGGRLRSGDAGMPAGADGGADASPDSGSGGSQDPALPASQAINTGIDPAAPLPASLQQPAWLLIVRDRRDRVGFLAANALTLALVEALRQAGGRQRGDAVLDALAARHGIDTAIMRQAGAGILAQLRARDIVPGTAMDSGRAANTSDTGKRHPTGGRAASSRG